MTNVKKLRTHLLGGIASTLFVAGAAIPASAQEMSEPGPAAETAAQDEVIVVTGSRIARPNLEGPSPVTVVGDEDIKLSGSARVEDVLNALPQTLAGQSSTTSMGASGTATVNLRGLGATRTLVLINGRRLVPGDPVSNPVADLNAVPSSLIKRVDVLTGGASATYGADAVAGVVNFILDNTFSGLRLDAQYSVYQHDNGGHQDIADALDEQGWANPRGSTVGGGTFDATITGGTSFADGRGHITAYAGYRKTEPILQTSYNYAACAINEMPAPDSGFTCGGSQTSGPGGLFNIYTDSSMTQQIDADPTVPGNQAFTVDQSVPGGAFIPFVSPRDLFNTSSRNYFQRNDERYTAGVFAEFEASDSFTPYLEFSYMDDKTNAVIAPGGIFSSATYTIPCDNPLLSAQQVALICPDPTQTEATAVIGRRNVEGGGRNALLQHTSYRAVIGARGNINDNWSYDIYGQYGRTDYRETYTNEFSKTAIQRALNVVADPQGAPVCASVLDGSDPACVPYNIFTPNSITPEVLTYLQRPLEAEGRNVEKVVSGSITGNLGDNFRLPWASQPIGVAFGAEYRSESLRLDTDPLWQMGDGAGQNPLLPQRGSFNVKEFFAETHIPIIEDGLLWRASIDAGYRYSKYSTAGSTHTYKFGAEIAPVPALVLRASFNRAVRAPNIVELFAPQRTGTFTGNDPCAGATPRFTLEQCAFQGVTPAQYGNIQPNPAGQYQSFGGGNADLKPETADTFTAGFVLQPEDFLPGLAVTVDYFNIKVDNIINTVGPQLLLNLCGETGDPIYCSTIHRQPGTGSLFLSSDYYVDDRMSNIGEIATAGIDVGVSYGLDIGSEGRLNLSMMGTYLDKFVVTPGTIVDGVSSYDCAGLYGGTTCGSTTGGGVPRPKWRHRVRATYSPSEQYSFAVSWRHVGGVDAYTTSDNPFLSGVVYPVDAHLDARDYFDLNVAFNVVEEFSLNFGVNNIFDKDPPLAGSRIGGSGRNGNTFPGVYDALGRYLHVSASIKY